jgi:4-hydroxyacetophenone monooxygenase
MATTNVEISHELLEASDDQIEDAVAYADPLVLRGLLYQLTGDEEVAATKTSLALGGFGSRRVAAEEDVPLLRRKAVEFLKAHRDSGAGPIGPGPPGRLRKSVMLVFGEADIPEDLLLYQLEELALDPWARELKWREQPDPGKVQGFSVTVIGAALSGLNAAVLLKRAGIPYTVFEKNSEVGGVWNENRYPGARLDTPSRSYTHLFAANFDYPNPFSGWAENQRYMNWVADEFGLREDIVLDTEVRSLAWDEAAGVWEVETEGPNGVQAHRSNAVITAVGSVGNRPNIPEIEGVAEFGGRLFHSARLPADFDPSGKRIAVVGTGCSGYQMTPELALEADRVVTFQRTPQWMFPVQGYRSPFPPQIPWLDRNMPYYANFTRMRANEGAARSAATTTIDPDFDDLHAVSEINKSMRDAAVAFLESKIADPELRAKMIPSHPVWSARPVLVDPEYSVLDAIQRDNVTLVTDGIRRINQTGIEANDGTQYDVDVIIYATGFLANEFLFPMTVTGRGGLTVREFWREGGARAYTYTMIPHFPNLWMLMGPNTNGAQPSAFGELHMSYALQCIERLIREDHRSMEAKEEAYWRYNKELDARNRRKVWSDPRAHNYYWIHEHGRSPLMQPFAQHETWRMLHQPNWDDIDIS